MDIPEIPDDMLLQSFLWGLYLSMISIGGVENNYEHITLSNTFFKADVKVTIEKVLSDDDKKNLSNLWDMDIDELINQFKNLILID